MLDIKVLICFVGKYMADLNSHNHCELSGFIGFVLMMAGVNIRL